MQKHIEIINGLGDDDLNSNNKVTYIRKYRKRTRRYKLRIKKITIQKENTRVSKLA